MHTRSELREVPRELHATYILPGTMQIIYGVHARDDCIGRNCCIHNPSDHPFVAWPMEFRQGHMFRVGPSGLRYPDPDDLAYHRMLADYETNTI